MFYMIEYDNGDFDGIYFKYFYEAVEWAEKHKFGREYTIEEYFDEEQFLEGL